MTTGRSIRLFWVDGAPNGLATAEIMNWSGQVVAAPRASLPRFLARAELARAGVYFLVGPDAADVGTRLYIGESDHVANRIAQHNRDPKRAFWRRACAVTSKDGNLTKAHARYLEALLIEVASARDDVVLDNDKAPDPPALPEADRADMAYFVEQIGLILPALGFDVLPSTLIDDEGDHSPAFELESKKHGVRARAREVGSSFVVLEGSLARATWSGVGEGGYAKLHARLIERGKLGPAEDGVRRFTADTTFQSPSAASAVLLGRSDNGRTSWRVAGARATYAEWQEGRG